MKPPKRKPKTYSLGAYHLPAYTLGASRPEKRLGAPWDKGIQKENEAYHRVPAAKRAILSQLPLVLAHQVDRINNDGDYGGRTSRERKRATGAHSDGVCGTSAGIKPPLSQNGSSTILVNLGDTGFWRCVRPGA